MNKRADEIVMEQAIFIILNLIFFLTLLYFVYNSSSGAFVNEQYYAKQIALMIDESKPGTVISIDVTDGYKLVKKNKFDEKNMIKITDKDVLVRLSSSRTYQFPYFNNVLVETSDYPFRISNDNGKERIFFDMYIQDKG
ncbi:hypothetical protein HYW74_04890 [Candidatus Pacearchaeota archaeon]|nr:hypothetical protein [Candidatus Pacearchaeota archaeon]